MVKRSGLTMRLLNAYLTDYPDGMTLKLHFPVIYNSLVVFLILIG